MVHRLTDAVQQQKGRKKTHKSMIDSTAWSLLLFFFFHENTWLPDIEFYFLVNVHHRRRCFHLIFFLLFFLYIFYTTHRLLNGTVNWYFVYAKISNTFLHLFFSSVYLKWWFDELGISYTFIELIDIWSDFTHCRLHIIM